MDQRVEVLTLRETEHGLAWEVSRLSWANVELSGQKNNFSMHGVGAAGVTLLLRRQPLELTQALRWRGRHCFLTGLIPMGRLHWRAEAALVTISQCQDGLDGMEFPAVVTEQYHRHDQLEPMAINELRHVLVTPKAVILKPGRLVRVDGTDWPILTAHTLDPYKNEYEIGRVTDL